MFPSVLKRGLPILLLLVAAAAAGCNSSSSTAPAAPNFLAIASISPPAGAKLAPGRSASFAANVTYMLNNAASATLTLVFEDQNNNMLNTGNQPTTILPAGQGTATLTGQIAVPATGVTSLQVLFVLTANTGMSAPTVVSAVYPVG
jgi:hypothetical protein